MTDMTDFERLLASWMEADGPQESRSASSMPPSGRLAASTRGARGPVRPVLGPPSGPEAPTQVGRARGCTPPGACRRGAAGRGRPLTGSARSCREAPAPSVPPGRSLRPEASTAPQPSLMAASSSWVATRATSSSAAPRRSGTPRRTRSNRRVPARGTVRSHRDAPARRSGPRGRWLSRRQRPACLGRAVDPEQGTFTAGGSLSDARADHTATLLPDGRVLIIGGSGVGQAPLDSIEVWVPDIPRASRSLARWVRHAAVTPRRASWTGASSSSAVATTASSLRRRSGTRGPETRSRRVAPGASGTASARCWPTVGCSSSAARTAALASAEIWQPMPGRLRPDGVAGHGTQLPHCDGPLRRPRPHHRQPRLGGTGSLGPGHRGLSLRGSAGRAARRPYGDAPEGRSRAHRRRHRPHHRVSRIGLDV